MYLLMDIRVEHCFYRVTEIEEGCKITLDEVSYEIERLGGKVCDHYLDYENSEVIIDIEPAAIYSMLVLQDHWLKAYIRTK